MSKRRTIPPEPSWVGILSSKLDNQTQILKKIQSNKITVHLKEILSCVVCKEIGIKMVSCLNAPEWNKPRDFTPQSRSRFMPIS